MKLLLTYKIAVNKMKKTTLLIFLITLCFQFANAQSDATREETLDWINVYGFSDLVQDGNWITCNVKLKDSLLEIDKYEVDYSGFEQDQELPNGYFRFWSGCLPKGIGGAGFILSAEDVKKMTITKQNGNYYLILRDIDNYIHSFCWSNKEKAIRVGNAFQHFFKLIDINVEFKDNLSLEDKF